MDSLIRSITLRSIIKFIIIWLIIFVIMMILYIFFIDNKKTYYKGVFVQNESEKVLILCIKDTKMNILN